MGEIAAKIKKLRIDVGWNQVELAKRAGVTAAAVSMIEAELRQPSPRVVGKISEALRVSVSDLVGESPLQSKNEQDIFFRKFHDLRTLSKSDQRIIEELVQRLKPKARAI